MGEHIPILRYLAMHHGYYPKDPVQAQQSEDIVLGSSTSLGKIAAIVFTPDQAAKAGMIEDVFTNILPKYLKAIDSHFTAHKFLVSDELSWADFYLGGNLYLNCAKNPMIYAPERWAELLDQFPNF